MKIQVRRRRRLSAISLAAGLAVLALLLPTMAGLVSAHTYSETLTCSKAGAPTLTVNLGLYSATHTNSVTITIDSVLDSADSNSNFGTTFTLTKTLSPSTTSHTVTVVVVSGDGVGGHTWTKTLEACQEATEPPTEPPTAAPTDPPTAAPTEPPTEAPTESFAGETGTPAVSLTPPPTSSGGNGPTNSSIPLLALLICLAFGGLGIAAVETQRRTIRH